MVVPVTADTCLPQPSTSDADAVLCPSGGAVPVRHPSRMMRDGVRHTLHARRGRSYRDGPRRSRATSEEEHHHATRTGLEYAVIAFPGSEFNGEVAPALGDLVDSGTIRVIDLAFVTKDLDGTPHAAELTELAARRAGRVQRCRRRREWPPERRGSPRRGGQPGARLLGSPHRLGGPVGQAVHRGGPRVCGRARRAPDHPPRGRSGGPRLRRVGRVPTSSPPSRRRTPSATQRSTRHDATSRTQPARSGGRQCRHHPRHEQECAGPPAGRAAGVRAGRR